MAGNPDYELVPVATDIRLSEFHLIVFETESHYVTVVV